MMEPTRYSTWNQDEQKLFRDMLKSLLRDGKVTVHFKKKDNTIRVMDCTLKPELVKDYEKKTDRVKEENDAVCPVFDIEKQEWRSFRYDTITMIEGNFDGS